MLWLALALNAVTGILLLIAYPTKALTNPLFYLKLFLVAVAVTLVYRIATDVLCLSELDQKSAAHVKPEIRHLVPILMWLRRL